MNPRETSTKFAMKRKERRKKIFGRKFVNIPWVMVIKQIKLSKTIKFNQFDSGPTPLS